MNEVEKYQVIKKLVETKGNKLRASKKLNCTVRTINRNIMRYEQFGKDAFVHGNRNRKPSCSIDLVLKDKVLNLYQDVYYDCNVQHFSELLESNENITISQETLLIWLKEINILSPKARRIIKRTLRAKLKQELQSANKKETREIENQITKLEHSEIHPRRSRLANFGELLQMDASNHHWFGERQPRAHLHATIDDATGKILGGHFEEQETLQGYYTVLYQVLRRYGIPYQLQTDNRMVFTNNKKVPSSIENTHVNFAYACDRLGINLKTTSVPEANGRIERLFQTLQSRLIPELRLQKIKSIEEANRFLPSYIDKFNSHFSLHIDDSKNVFESQPSQAVINETLAVIKTRVVDKGHSIKFENNFYIPINEKGNQDHLMRNTKCNVIITFDKSLYLSTKDEIFALELIPERLEHSNDFSQIIKKEPKPQYIPPMSHPMKHGSYQNYLARKQYSNQSTHV